MEGRLLLDVVVCQGAAILQLLASKDQALLVRGDACSRLIAQHNTLIPPKLPYALSTLQLATTRYQS